METGVIMETLYVLWKLKWNWKSEPNPEQVAED